MKRFAILSLALAVGCFEEEEPRLLLPGEVRVAWETAYNGEQDGLGALVPLDVMVYDGASGQPLGDVEILIWTEDETAWPVPAEGVWVVDPDACEGCDALWDASRDEYVEVEPVEGTLVLRTDALGIARTYLYVDSFPDGESADFEPIPVLVSMGTTDETLLLTPW